MLIREHSAITRRGLTEQPLAGQHALVTGANSGIGKVVAIALAEVGTAVAVNYVAGEDDAHGVTDQIAAADGQAIALRADVSSEDRSRQCSRRLALPSIPSTTSSPTPGCSPVRRCERQRGLHRNDNRSEFHYGGKRGEIETMMRSRIAVTVSALRKDV